MLLFECVQVIYEVKTKGTFHYIVFKDATNVNTLQITSIFLLQEWKSIIQIKLNWIKLKKKLVICERSWNRSCQPRWSSWIPLLWKTLLCLSRMTPGLRWWSYPRGSSRWRASPWWRGAPSSPVDPACWPLGFGGLSSASAALLWDCGTSWAILKGGRLTCWDWGLWFWPSASWWWEAWWRFTSWRGRRGGWDKRKKKMGKRFWWRLGGLSKGSLCEYQRNWPGLQINMFTEQKESSPNFFFFKWNNLFSGEIKNSNACE